MHSCKWLLAGAAALCLTTVARAEDDHRSAVRADHVLLISVDGMHEVDLRLWIKNNPTGALAALAKHGLSIHRHTLMYPRTASPACWPR
jgi:hypothetical protein